MLHLNEIKSAETITDPEQIAALLESADLNKKNSDPLKDQMPDTTYERTDKGLKVTKHLSGQSILQVRGVPSSDEVRKLAESKGIPWKDEYMSRLIPYWASDERVDRHGDIVKQNWSFEDFEKNNIMLYSHSWDLPPIGAVLDWSVSSRNDKDYSGKALYLLTLFATKEQWDWADTIFRLVSGGFLKSGSVGFYPGTIIDVKDEEEREQLGLGRWGYILDNNSLIEWSPTSVPANTGAHVVLNSMKENNLLKFEDAPVIRELERQQLQRGEGDIEAWKQIDATICRMWKDLFDKDLPEHNELDEPFIEAEKTATEEQEESETISDVDPDPEEENEKTLEDVSISVEECKEMLLSIKKSTEAFSNALDELKNEFSTFSEDMTNNIEIILESGTNSGKETNVPNEEQNLDEDKKEALLNILNVINNFNDSFKENKNG